MPILTASQLKKYYQQGNNTVKALDGIDLTVEEGEFVAIVGTSGSGKSTLLNMLGGLDYPTSGGVSIRGVEFSRLNDNQLTIFRRRNIGFVFQDYNLVPILNVYDNITLPAELDGGAVDRAFIEDIIESLGLTDKMSALPGQLSGGQQQRVAIARALASKPAILLADEPTGNLDSRTTTEVMGLLKLSGERYRQTIIMITHNEALAQLCGRVLHIEDGKLAGDTRNRETACRGEKGGGEREE
ncbi:ABC transporter ATP-binding protein [Lactonifactor longoviformis]|uniref:Putative ABC transport system ATP-binding protein n=1 Tax=Lactonifactor longoviformis DSM 17459 TaxID=1122155 RepID=A0A1M4WFP6_9CLOT|nr:ABC transporter ATP-binding protein [Lactonifactor longoviformis]POP32672.1 ABC transporter ATP-binding protein [Lactonifactor longoviformis]SHE80058.1 putative ABC transport system ATP-binding protein [Lactonifactor longoviformis DSM 17459]